MRICKRMKRTMQQWKKRMERKGIQREMEKEKKQCRGKRNKDKGEDKDEEAKMEDEGHIPNMSSFVLVNWHLRGGRVPSPPPSPHCSFPPLLLSGRE